MTPKPAAHQETLPRLSAIWWGIIPRLAFALVLVVMLWAVIGWALR